jgi:hypothetical protein
VSHPQVAEPGARFAASGELLPPVDYRHWTFLTSGLGMTYGPLAAAPSAPPNFDTVFVDPRSYDEFVATGTWREGATFVVEVRTSEHTGSIVHGGSFQTDLAGVEVEIKDAKRFPSGWGFFGFDAALARPAKLLPPTATCYDCHATHAAVENTFTQFYPTLFAVAKAKHTVRPDFVGIPPSSNDLYDAILAGGWARARDVLDATATRWPEAALLGERPLNLLAYRLLAAGKTADAIAVFVAVTQQYPSSANAWDSLGEALEGAKRFADARDATARGLAVVAADPSPQRAAIEQSLRDREARLPK